MTTKELQEIIDLLQRGEERGSKLYWYGLVLPHKAACIHYINGRKNPDYEDSKTVEDIVIESFIKIQEKLLSRKAVNIPTKFLERERWWKVVCWRDYLNYKKKITQKKEDKNGVIEIEDVEEYLFKKNENSKTTKNIDKYIK